MSGGAFCPSMSGEGKGLQEVCKTTLLCVSEERKLLILASLPHAPGIGHVSRSRCSRMAQSSSTRLVSIKFVGICAQEDHHIAYTSDMHN